jgi:hypothetical protein
MRGGMRIELCEQILEHSYFGHAREIEARAARENSRWGVESFAREIDMELALVVRRTLLSPAWSFDHCAVHQDVCFDLSDESGLLP